MSRKPSLKSYPHFQFNPFIGELVESFASKDSQFAQCTKTTPYAINADSKPLKTVSLEGQERIVFKTTQYVDKEEFVKVYSGHLRLFHSLSLTDLDLLEYAISQLKKGMDTIFLYPLLIAPILGVSKQTIYCSLAVLLERNLIAKAEFSDKYFINPSVIFKGDRIAVIVETIKKP